MELTQNFRPTDRYVRFLAYVAVVVLLNLAAVTFFFRLDLTANGIFSISPVSRNVVSSLSEPLTINVFFSENLPAPHNATERYLRDLLAEYGVHANRHFNYRFHNVSAAEGDLSEAVRRNQELAESYGVFPVQVQNIEQDEVKFQRAYMGMALIHGDLVESIPAITSTDGLEYRITTTIRKLNNKIGALLALPEPIRVDLYLSAGLQLVAPFMRIDDPSALPGQVRGVVEKLKDKTYGKLVFAHHDPDVDPDAAEIATRHGLFAVSWPALRHPDGSEIPPGKGMAGVIMSRGERVEIIPIIQVMRIPLIGTRYEVLGPDLLEETILATIDRLVDIHSDIGYLAEKGALPLDNFPAMMGQGGDDPDAATNFRQLLGQNYSVKEFRFGQGDPIPAGVTTLVVTRPREVFTEWELFQLDQFLMRGNSLALFLDAFQEINPGQQGFNQFNQGPLHVTVHSGLEQLLAHYGAGVRASYVLDENCFRQQVPARFGGGERPIYFAPLIQRENINHGPGFMRNTKALVMLKASPLELNQERIREAGLQATTLFSSSDKSWEMSGQINLNPLFLQPPPPGQERGRLPLAALLEGAFPSYFAGKPIPERPKTDDPAATPASAATADLQAEGVVLTQGRPGRILLVGTSEILKNNVIDEDGQSPNAVFVMNALDYLNGREGIAVMRGKEQRFNPLGETSAGTKTFVKAFHIAGLPAVVVVAGLGLWARRNVRRRRIQDLFQEK